MRGSRFNGMFDDGIFALFGEGNSGPDESIHQSPLRKQSLIEQNLPCLLEELYKGTTKKMKISREVLDANRGA
ncbi:hypothetical protein ACH5RR_001360 [Cinchona calisaya]|uniref:Uncharacterized protein n=1 Tax=Cinchona calisaya TaxID=153742 RepID=A0ABD3B4E6_9GENT